MAARAVPRICIATQHARDLALRGLQVVEGPSLYRESVSRHHGVTVAASGHEVSLATYTDASVFAERTGGEIINVAAPHLGCVSWSRGTGVVTSPPPGWMRHRAEVV